MNLVEKCVCGAVISIPAEELLTHHSELGARRRQAKRTCEACGRVHSYEVVTSVSEAPVKDEANPEMCFITIHLKNSGGNYIGFTMPYNDAVNYARHHLEGKIGISHGLGTIFDTQRPGNVLAQFDYQQVTGFKLTKMKRDELGHLVVKEE